MSRRILKPGPLELAKKFHDTYEELAPSFDYKTREASAKPWSLVPSNNRALMVATCTRLLTWLELEEVMWIDERDDQPEVYDWVKEENTEAGFQS